MVTIFNVKFEFDKDEVIKTIMHTINKNEKGYVFVIDGNVLTNANKSDFFQKIINKSIVNVCDGSIIVLLASLIYKQKFDTFVGPDLFIKLLEKSKNRSYFLGNQSKVLNGLRKNLSKIDSSIGQMIFEPLPFLKIDEFDYESIGEKINKDNPDLIWISLGAPKQEEFIYKLLPFINRGVIIAVGAVFNFYSEESEEKRSPKNIQKLKLEWIYRTIKNPKKQLPKAISFIKIIPKLYLSEKRKEKNNK